MWRYRLLLLVLALPLIVVSLWQAIKNRDAKLLLQRLGFALPAGNEPVTWIHCASVGEVNAVIPFIQLLKEKYPGKPLLVTTNTPTGKRVLHKHFPGIAHSYLSLDFSWVSQAFVKRIQPCCALVFETEIWPNLFTTLHRHHIPLVIFNGRVSQKTLRAHRRFAGAYMSTLDKVSCILARSETDKNHFITLGADEKKIEVIGNIKYAGSHDNQATAMDLGRPYILAASTRDGEEKLVVETLQEVLDKQLLVIAPRHPQRLAEIEKDLSALNTRIAVRSRNEPVTANTQVYIADTLGELGQFIAGSQFVLMGGAFLPFGGHNILEVGQAGKAVIFGSHMDNFSDEAASYVAASAAIQVADTEQLKQAVLKLIEQPADAELMGKHGRELMTRNASIAHSYLDKISQLCQL